MRLGCWGADLFGPPRPSFSTPAMDVSPGLCTAVYLATHVCTHLCNPLSPLPAPPPSPSLNPAQVWQFLLESGLLSRLLQHLPAFPMAPGLTAELVGMVGTLFKEHGAEEEVAALGALQVGAEGERERDWGGEGRGGEGRAG